ncbi:patatin family protein [Vibrio sp. HN007]|uniref:patatin-like phospholipase family protein n=1 Tax=Vibrio iocasae TaxID=3098914 RepID=UPI0035D3E171
MSNRGVVSGTETLIDTSRYTKYLEGRTALVAQGGGQRSIFTAGVLDSFILSNFDPFDIFYGTSAGALNICAFLCRQNGLGKSFILDLTTDDNFFHLFSYIRRKQGLNLEWALERICDYPYKLDLDMGRRSLGDRIALASLTDAKHLNDHYLPILDDNWYDVMRATCAIPGIYSDEITINGFNYVDGGVSAAIPVQEAWRNAARNIVVIRTESLDEESEEEEPVRHNVWYREPVITMQERWQSVFEEWKSEWSGFWQDQLSRSKEAKPHKKHLNMLNGGRWLFGAEDIYRLSHLFGDKFDSGIADLMMVHYQTYSLTQEFLRYPPDDCFIVQITPHEPLRSSPLLSKKEDLLHDYESGLMAGYNYIESYVDAKNQIWRNK